MATKFKTDMNTLNLVEVFARFFVSATMMYMIVESKVQASIVMGLVMLVLAIWIVLPALETKK